jgi:hypothetical protein
MIHNNLFVNRLTIFTNSGKIAYDEIFHKGVNIIRGENSSGKSTITHFIFFGLGGYFVDFVPEVRYCSEIYLETEMNGAVFTIKRPLFFDEKGKINPRVPMYFYWGDYEESKNPPSDKTWLKFDYNSYPDKKSFSNVIFDNLNVPIVKGDNNITVHQLLRLMYIDQESPTSSLFLYEQFDSQITRETTADLLLGVYNEELYQRRKRLIQVEKEIDEIKGQIRVTKGFFSDPLTLNPEHIKTKISESEKQISEIENSIISIKELDKKDRPVLEEENKFRYQELSDKIVNQRNIVNELNDEIKKINFEINDNDFFIETLEEKLKALKNSVATRDFLGNLSITLCPECLSEIKPNESHSNCKLCKEPIDSTFGITQARRMEQEIGFQISESQSIQKSFRQRLNQIIPKFESDQQLLYTLQRQYDSEVKDVRSSYSEKIENLYIQKGFVEGEILQFNTMLENAEFYNRLINQNQELGKEKDNLKAYLFYTEKQQESLKQQIKMKIKEEAIYLLNNDLHRQDEFKNANAFHIDFPNNIAFLSNDYAKYSASSNFYLKITARFALFLASLHIPEMRYPRFILADNMEDKGIEEKRAQNFQKILIDRLSSFNPNSYQVIFTTSYITEELNNSKLVVGEFYTKENRTLKNLQGIT